MSKKTALFEQHLQAGGKMVDFAGWQMPIHYGSQLQEHHQVRQHAGMFDVSHMTMVDLRGAKCREFLRYLLANDVGRLKTAGKALYSCMLQEDGGIIDDLIVYFMDNSWFRMVVNAATRDKDLAWIRQHAPRFSVTVQERRDLSMLAVQGPKAREICQQVLAAFAPPLKKLVPFQAWYQEPWFIARTGYTGEEGYEILIPHTEALSLWEQLLVAGVSPCGLGARDTLRLEAGMHLYGSDMDEACSPLECGLAWTVALEPNERDFSGRTALEQQKRQGLTQQLVGLVLQDKGVLRHGQTLYMNNAPCGVITSGSYAPTLEKSIALASVSMEVTTECEVEIRDKKLKVQVVKPPFVRHGKALLIL